MIPVTNNTAMPIYVGAEMIPPGETRLFHDHLVPEHLKPAAEAEAPAEEAAQDPDPIAELAEQSAKEIIDALESLTDEQLDQLAAIEQAKGEKARSTVLKAIAELTLKRAEA